MGWRARSWTAARKTALLFCILYPAWRYLVASIFLLLPSKSRVGFTTMTWPNIPIVLQCCGRQRIEEGPGSGLWPVLAMHYTEYCVSMIFPMQVVYVGTLPNGEDWPGLTRLVQSTTNSCEPSSQSTSQARLLLLANQQPRDEHTILDPFSRTECSK